MGSESLQGIRVDGLEREVHYEGLVSNPDLILKLYHMYTCREECNQDLAKGAKDFLEAKVMGNIDPGLGLGFAILSADMLNVNVWAHADDVPVVLKNYLYEFEDNIEDALPVDLRKEAAYCIWELKVVNYEREEFMKFLKSKKTREDADRYSSSRIEGAL